MSTRSLAAGPPGGSGGRAGEWCNGRDTLVAQQSFERSIEVATDHREAWQVLTDPQRVVGWIDIVHSVEEIDRLRSYRAVLEDKVGPFRLRADIAIDVTVPSDGEAVDIRASGRDRALNSEISIDGHLRLTPSPSGGSRIAIFGQYTVTGRATTMGAGIVRKKGEAAVEQFVTNATLSLLPAGSSAGPEVTE